jgi:hypothetical protein
MFKMIIFLILVFWNHGFCVNVKIPKKHTLSVCAVFRNETKYLKEWIEYHSLVGVDHFYLYNNNSTDRFSELLKPYVMKKMVTVIHWPDCLGNLPEEKMFIWTLSTQISAYENAIQFRSKETKWLVFLDIDEFLTPVKGDNLGEILEHYDSYPGITLESEFFDAAVTSELPRKRLVIQSSEITKDPKNNVQIRAEKTIFKPDLCESFKWPPYKCVFKKKQNAIKIPNSVLQINHYLNRNKNIVNSEKPKNRIAYPPAGTDKKALLEAGYQIEDQKSPIYRFIPELLIKMGYQ